MPRYILGISAFNRDSSAALLADGQILGAAGEERFTRERGDLSFPVNSIRYLLNEGRITSWDQIGAVAFFGKPLLKFERLVETYQAFAPKGLLSFLASSPVWIKQSLFTRKIIREELEKIVPGKVKLLFPEHHLSHAASAFYPSPFEEAAILTIDGAGEWATTTIGHGKGKGIKILRQTNFPHSLGLFYSAVAHYCGFNADAAENKLMGLAPYGSGDEEQASILKAMMLNMLIDIREDGSILLNTDYFDFTTLNPKPIGFRVRPTKPESAAGMMRIGVHTCNEKKWEELFGFGRREPAGELTREYMDMALAAQEIAEEVVLRLAATAMELTGCKHLVTAGCAALNCSSNGKLARAGLFEDIWIQPAADDAGGALGAALAAWHVWKGMKRTVHRGIDAMKGACLGPRTSPNEVRRMTKKYRAPIREYAEFDQLCEVVAGLLADGNVVGWFQGRMEFGHRALGNRSILADPRNPCMQKRLNLTIKHREAFRPFALSVLAERVRDYFELDRPSPYMLMAAPVLQGRRLEVPDDYARMNIRDRLDYVRSDIPAVTHVDYSARIQSVSAGDNEKYWRLLRAFEEKTGCAVLMNTSFNSRGEPIVCTVDHAYECFLRTDMDHLVIENFLFAKTDQPSWSKSVNWQDGSSGFYS